MDKEERYNVDYLKTLHPNDQERHRIKDELLNATRNSVDLESIGGSGLLDRHRGWVRTRSGAVETSVGEPRSPSPSRAEILGDVLEPIVIYKTHVGKGYFAEPDMEMEVLEPGEDGYPASRYEIARKRLETAGGRSPSRLSRKKQPKRAQTTDPTTDRTKYYLSTNTVNPGPDVYAAPKSSFGKQVLSKFHNFGVATFGPKKTVLRDTTQLNPGPGPGAFDDVNVKMSSLSTQKGAPTFSMGVSRSSIPANYLVNKKKMHIPGPAHYNPKSFPLSRQVKGAEVKMATAKRPAHQKTSAESPGPVYDTREKKRGPAKGPLWSKSPHKPRLKNEWVAPGPGHYEPLVRPYDQSIASYNWGKYIGSESRDKPVRLDGTMVLDKDESRAPSRGSSVPSSRSGSRRGSRAGAAGKRNKIVTIDVEDQEIIREEQSEDEDDIEVVRGRSSPPPDYEKQWGKSPSFTLRPRLDLPVKDSPGPTDYDYAIDHSGPERRTMQSKFTDSPAYTSGKAPTKDFKKMYLTKAHNKERLSMSSPPPIQYNLSSTIGEQRSNISPTSPAKGFDKALRFYDPTSPQKMKKVVPSPNLYNPGKGTDAWGVLGDSTCHSFGTAERFKDLNPKRKVKYKRYDVPGPGAYSPTLANKAKGPAFTMRSLG